MEISLEKLLMGIVIGIALCLFVNRVFMVEGVTDNDDRIMTLEECQNIDAGCGNDFLCLDTAASPVVCTIHSKDKCLAKGMPKSFIFCDDSSPSPSSPPSPPSPPGGWNCFNSGNLPKNWHRTVPPPGTPPDEDWNWCSEESQHCLNTVEGKWECKSPDDCRSQEGMKYCPPKEPCITMYKELTTPEGINKCLQYSLPESLKSTLPTEWGLRDGECPSSYILDPQAEVLDVNHNGLPCETSDPACCKVTSLLRPPPPCIKKHFIDGNKCFEYKIPPDFSGWAGSNSGGCPSKYNTESSTEDVTGDCITGFPDCCKKTIKEYTPSQEEICNKLINESDTPRNQIDDCLTKNPGCEFEGDPTGIGKNKCIAAPSPPPPARCNNALKDGGGNVSQIENDFIDEAFCENYGITRGLNCKTNFHENVSYEPNCTDVNPPPPTCENKKFSMHVNISESNKNKQCEDYGKQIGKKCKYKRDQGISNKGGKCVNA
uniref:Uncharacterized protein n=1 Tax=viral metagenome TaxID=1070528 RepID=A0A6C0FKK0_9ZZZZ|tara:strand:- start:2581 stop:4041 length:1461 start_codon:yes stop_codon:yes gene_type:complete